MTEKPEGGAVEIQKGRDAQEVQHSDDLPTSIKTFQYFKTILIL